MYKIVKRQGADDMVVKNDWLWIPMNEENSDYREYLEWASEGNEAEVEEVEE